MLDHVELYVTDLTRSVAFWTPLMRFLGCEADPWPGGINYRPSDGGPYVSLLEAESEHAVAGYHRKHVGLNHIAFGAGSRETVDRIREWARYEGHPLLYDDRYPFATAPDYYAVFVEDPDRMKIEVVASAEGTKEDLSG